MSRKFIYDHASGEVVEVGPEGYKVPPRADNEIVSDAIGFTAKQLPEMEADRKANGFSGIEFRVDPTEPTFRQVVAHDRKTFERYCKHRGVVNKSGDHGSFKLTAADFERAKELVSRHG